MKASLAPPLAKEDLISHTFWPLALVLSRFFFSSLSDFLWTSGLVKVFSLLSTLPVSSP